jgi:hypothetical protein
LDVSRDELINVLCEIRDWDEGLVGVPPQGQTGDEIKGMMNKRMIPERWMTDRSLCMFMKTPSCPDLGITKWWDDDEVWNKEDEISEYFSHGEVAHVFISREDRLQDLWIGIQEMSWEASLCWTKNKIDDPLLYHRWESVVGVAFFIIMKGFNFKYMTDSLIDWASAGGACPEIKSTKSNLWTIRKKRKIEAIERDQRKVVKRIDSSGAVALCC